MSKKSLTKGIIQKQEQATTRSFGYELDGIQLSFSLRVDRKKDLISFMRLMEAAEKEIRDVLADLDQRGVK